MGLKNNAVFICTVGIFFDKIKKLLSAKLIERKRKLPEKGFIYCYMPLKVLNNG